MAKSATILTWCGLAVGLVALAGCGDDADDAAKNQRGDAALSAALDDPLMVDPGLGGQDQADAGLTAALPGSAAMPEVDRSKAAITEARDQAARLSGGKLASAPMPQDGDATGAAFAAVTAEQLGAALPGTARACVQAMRYSTGWAARFPAALPPYPQSHVLEAAGTDSPACRLQAARFITPVGRQDVTDFYHARLRALGSGTSHQAAGSISVMTLTAPDRAAYLVRITERDDGLVEVALASRN